MAKEHSMNPIRELFSVAGENSRKLKNRVVVFCDEFDTMPPFEVLSVGQSWKPTMLPIIQSLEQIE